MIRSHAVSSSDPIQEGGSAIALCGKPINKTHWLAFTELIPYMQEAEVRIDWTDITCKTCKYAVWPERGHIYAAIEAEEYELLKAKGKVA